MVSLLRPFIVATLHTTFAFGSEQGYAVKGRLLCGTSPAANVEVKLVDIDLGKDDPMDKKFTDHNGEFLLQGSTKEITTIDPRLKIYHECGDWKPGKRRWRLDLPKKYVEKGHTHPFEYDVGVLNLESKLLAEDRELF